MTDEIQYEEIDDAPAPRRWSWVGLFSIVFASVRNYFGVWSTLFDEVAYEMQCHRAYRDEQRSFATSVSRDLETLTVAESM